VNLHDSLNQLAQIVNKQVVLALVWDVAESITLCVNKKGIHPGAHIALNFLIFAGLMSGGPIDIINGIYGYNDTSPVLTAAGVFTILTG
jgi:hypothetical protein